MKQCPKCGNSYTDDTLNFCLADGSALTIANEKPAIVPVDDPNKTEQLPSNITAQQGAADQYFTQPTQKTKTKSSPIIKIVLAVLALGFLVVLGAGIAGGLFYFYTGNQVAVFTSPTPPLPPPPSPAATPWTVPSASPKDSNDDETKLEDEVTKLLKQLEDSTNSSSDDEDAPTWAGRTATVNSPKDGFLALRNLPSSDIGQRIAKIPHGEKISVLTCAPQSVTIAGRSGHWCMTTYEKKTGWVFDVWLTFDSKN